MPRLDPHFSITLFFSIQCYTDTIKVVWEYVTIRTASPLCWQFPPPCLISHFWHTFQVITYTTILLIDCVYWLYFYLSFLEYMSNEVKGLCLLLTYFIPVFHRGQIHGCKYQIISLKLINLCFLKVHYYNRKRLLQMYLIFINIIKYCTNSSILF